METIFDTANRTDRGIYVRSDTHLCGYDFISFEKFFDINDFVNGYIDLTDISGGIYIKHEFDGLTIPEVLEKVGRRGFSFELSNIIR